MTSAEPDRDTGPAPSDAAAAPPEPTAASAEPVTIRDKRKVSLTGGKHARPDDADEAPPEPADRHEPSGGGLGAELEALRAERDERIRDLQRITAEYANYRKRVDRDRSLVSEQAVANVLSALLPVLDDLDRARDHGELPDGVAAIADHLVATTAKFGLTAFGERGDPFDPNLHEAVAHQTSPDVDTVTCVDVLRRGYQLGNRLLRPAMVAVAAPGPAPEPTQ